MIERRGRRPTVRSSAMVTRPGGGRAGSGSAAGGAAEQLRIADVQERGKQRQAPPPPPPEHYVAGVAAADQDEVTRRGRLRVVAVEFQLAPVSMPAMTSGSALILVRRARSATAGSA